MSLQCPEEKEVALTAQHVLTQVVVSRVTEAWNKLASYPAGTSCQHSC